MSVTPRKKASAANRQRHHRARLRRIAARRRQVPLGGNRAKR